MILEVKWAQFAKVVLEIIVSLSRLISMFLCSSYSHFIIPCLACYQLAAKVFLVYVAPNSIYTDPGSVGDIRGSCTADYGKHQVPFLYSSSTLTNKLLILFPLFFFARI